MLLFAYSANIFVGRFGLISSRYPFNDTHAIHCTYSIIFFISFWPCILSKLNNQNKCIAILFSPDVPTCNCHHLKYICNLEKRCLIQTLLFHTYSICWLLMRYKHGLMKHVKYWFIWYACNTAPSEISSKYAHWNAKEV